jgi:hypothetical protein
MTAIAIHDGEKSYERACFGNERTLFVRIVAFRHVLARTFDVLYRVNQVAVGNHGMMGRFLEFPAAVVFGGAALVLGGVLEEFRSFQMMINALLRHVFRIANAVQSETFERHPPFCSPGRRRDGRVGGPSRVGDLRGTPANL